MPIFRYLKRKWLLSQPLPNSRLRILENRVPYYKRLPADLKSTLQDRVKIFMNEKLFEGCNGLKMTEEKKVILSAYACVLLLGEPSDYYADLQSILVYPDDYRAPVHEEDEAGVITTGTEARKGEFWNVGSIVISWKDLENNIRSKAGNRNIIFHEFSHQLDEQYGLSAGVDERGEVHRDDEWSHIMAKTLKQLRKKVRRGIPGVLDPYGAEHPVELFAVATEAFFLKPAKLKKEYPEFYDGLQIFYNINPSDFIK